MSAYNPSTDSSFVTASNKSLAQNDERECPHCGKEYDADGRARAAFIRHVAECRETHEGQASLEAWL